MGKNYQPRMFLNLADESEEIRFIKDVLKSPLDLASDIIKYLFEDDLCSLKEKLDVIKGFSAGITRSEQFSSEYALLILSSYVCFSPKSSKFVQG